MKERIVQVLDCDPELGESLEATRLARAKLEARARVQQLQPGIWREQDWPRRVLDGFGLLMLDGLLVRRVNLGGRQGAELLSCGDLLRPWQQEDATASVMRSSGWRVLESANVAVLDIDFAHRIKSYPEIVAQLMARILRRARHFAVNMAIVHQPRVETRTLMLLWHLADRCGHVRPDGVLVPMRLTHAILADLLAARRPTVSGALSALERSGLVEQTSEGWMLSGSPPSELPTVAELSPDGASSATSQTT
ncbi:MAG TPA: Crp/Fnr family transcriptional regulator [Solirubrobacteraceae bacterium]|nr:Crp/Fnr family transcriptional regulator [Solirubrobacteraceae bacterium]